MGTKRKPSLEDAGKMLYKLIYPRTADLGNGWEGVDKRKYIKLALEVWIEVERCI